jgi:lactate/malate dehydrogenase, NAD binding domain
VHYWCGRADRVCVRLFSTPRHRPCCLTPRYSYILPHRPAIPRHQSPPRRLVFAIARGEVFGADVPVSLRLLDLPVVQGALEGLKMELVDSALPLLKAVVSTDAAEVAFADVDVAILVGGRPRVKGMERRELLSLNGAIFREQGAALDRVRGRDLGRCCGLVECAGAPAVDDDDGVFVGVCRWRRSR